MSPGPYVRRKIITDDLIELLIQITHKIKINSEKKIEKTLVKEIRKVHGKEKILFDMATTAIEPPERIIEKTLYTLLESFQKIKKV